MFYFGFGLIVASTYINCWFYNIGLKLQWSFSYSPRAVWTNTICHMSEGSRESLPVHQGQCLSDLKSQMRSHVSKTRKPSLSARKATFLGMLWKPRESGWLDRRDRRKTWRKKKKLLPAATHQHITPVTSYTPHFIWNAAAPRAEWYRWHIPSCLVAASSHALATYLLLKMDQVWKHICWGRST